MSSPPVSEGPDLCGELNSLLQGELAAVESYDRALTLFESYPAAAAELRRIRDEHRASVLALQKQIGAEGGTPVESSGAWGTFASVLTRAAKLIGPDTTLADLRRGEEQGIADYREALSQPLPPDCAELISRTLLPRCEAHAACVDRIREFLK